MRFKNEENQDFIFTTTTLQGQEAKCNVVIDVTIIIRKLMMMINNNNDYIYIF